MELWSPVFTTRICRGWDSNTQHYADKVNALTTAPPPRLINSSSIDSMSNPIYNICKRVTCGNVFSVYTINYKAFDHVYSPIAWKKTMIHIYSLYAWYSYVFNIVFIINTTKIWINVWQRKLYLVKFGTKIQRTMFYPSPYSLSFPWSFLTFNHYQRKYI